MCALLRTDSCNSQILLPEDSNCTGGIRPGAYGSKRPQPVLSPAAHSRPIHVDRVPQSTSLCCSWDRTQPLPQGFRSRLPRVFSELSLSISLARPSATTGLRANSGDAGRRRECRKGQRDTDKRARSPIGRMAPQFSPRLCFEQLNSFVPLTTDFCVSGTDSSESADSSDPAGEVLVVAVLPSGVVGEVQVSCHVRCALGRGPIAVVIDGIRGPKIAQPREFKIEIHLGQFVDRRRNQPLMPFKLKFAHRSAAETRIGQEAIMSLVFCLPVPTALPRAPGINVRKQPHCAPAL